MAAEKFVAAANELHADIVGVSALLTTTMKGQRNVIEMFDREGLRPGIRVIIGGAPVTRHWSEEIRADGFAKDAISAVNLVQKLIQEKAAQIVAQR